MGLNFAYNVDDFRAKAKRRLPKLVFDFLDGGVLEEYSLDANVRDFQSIELRPESLANLAGFDPRTSVFGKELDFPLMVSPMGILTMFHALGDVGIARAAARANSIFMHSWVSGVTIEDTARAISPERLFAQISVRSAAETEAYLKRVQNLGIDTLVLGAETASADKRERDLHNGLLTMPPKPPLKGLINFAMHPGWVLRWLTGPKFNFADYLIDGRPMKMKEMYQFMGYNGHEVDKGGWEGVAYVREKWSGNLVLKGIATPQAALKAVELGVDGVLVSNLGGRHFDGQPSTASVLPSIVQSVRDAGSDMHIFVDSGVRRGHDVVRALALGANAASAGRAFTYALAAYGERGVERMFDQLRSEFIVAMKSVGATTVGAIDPSVIAYNPHPSKYSS